MESKRFKITFFTDCHYADRDIWPFNCTQGLEKVKRVIEQTPDSNYYVNLGDFADYLKGGEISIYKSAVDFIKKCGLSTYTPINLKEKTVFNVLGNHEASNIEKKKLSDFIPYKDGIGSVYSFKIQGVLFVVLDANFNFQTGLDDCKTVKETRKFTFPQSQIEWLKEELKEKVTKEVKSIALISHIAYDFIDEKPREDLIKVALFYNIPVRIFEGHTHIGNFRTVTAHGKQVEIYTLAPITYDFSLNEEVAAPIYYYYTATFNEGNLIGVESFTKKLPI